MKKCPKCKGKLGIFEKEECIPCRAKALLKEVDAMKSREQLKKDFSKNLLDMTDKDFEETYLHSYEDWSFRPDFVKVGSFWAIGMRGIHSVIQCGEDFVLMPGNSHDHPYCSEIEWFFEVIFPKNIIPFDCLEKQYMMKPNSEEKEQLAA